MVPNTRISVAGGPAEITDSKGQFSIRISRDFIEGERVIIVVFKKNWMINNPLDGEWNLPNLKYQNVHTTRVIIVPKGSKKLGTHERIEKHIALLSDELAKLKKEGDKPKPIDFTYYLSQWATKYGFTSDEVKEEFDRWAKQADGSEDKRTRALSEFYRKNYALASRYFDEAALDDETELNRLQEKVRLKRLSAYKNWKDSGNSLITLYKFEDALERYQNAQRKLVNKKDFPKEWAEIGVLVGNAKSEIGIRTEGEKGNRFLEEAKQAYHQALEVYTRKDLPQDWAMTQNNLGAALQKFGEWENNTEYFQQSKTAIHSVYSVYKKAGYTQYDKYFKEKLRQLEQLLDELIEQQQNPDPKR
jgi:tetratricopeptide (TPR) repeat protein